MDFAVPIPGVTSTLACTFPTEVDHVCPCMSSCSCCTLCLSSASCLTKNVFVTVSEPAKRCFSSGQWSKNSLSEDLCLCLQNPPHTVITGQLFISCACATCWKIYQFDSQINNSYLWLMFWNATWLFNSLLVSFKLNHTVKHILGYNALTYPG